MIDKIAPVIGLRDWLFDRAEKLEAEGYQNGADGSRAWAEAVDALLAERAVYLEALRNIRDNSGGWQCDTANDAIARAEEGS